MGALTSSRKRNDEFLNFGSRQPRINSPEFQSSKRLKFSSSTPERLVSSRSTLSRVSRYPEAAPRLRREVHAPVRPHKFGSFTALSQFRATASTSSGFEGEERSGSKMGNTLSYNYEKVKKKALGSLRFYEVNEVVDLVDEEEPQKELMVSEDSSVEVIEVEDGLKGVEIVRANLQESVVSELSNGRAVVIDKTEEQSTPKSLDRDGGDFEGLSKHAYQKMLEKVRRSDQKIAGLQFEIQLNEEKLSSFELLRPLKKPEEELPHEPFIPLTKAEEEEVRRALSSNRRKVLVAHESSGIEITGEVLQCLRPGAWLNDEVINLYMELLKERERREPKRFLNCHFFNTFFYSKLNGNGYNYKSVRRWTTQRKLGYSLIDCDKIFVPIHQKMHWCLAVINKKDEKFQYLDSLGGRDREVLRVLAKYFVDEVKDKNGKDIDLRSWTQEYVEDLPQQENGYDCGVFMIKYADFYSRGLGLCFKQDHMPYFRQRTANEILKLRAN